MRLKAVQVELWELSKLEVHNCLFFFCIIYINNSNFDYFCSGYMAPEYLMQDQFSVKSDVFSFGVLMLEIVRPVRIV